MEKINKRIAVESVKVVLCHIAIAVCSILAVQLWFGTFFPVYVAGKLVLWRKLVRLGMYAGLAGIALFAMYACSVFYRRIDAEKRYMNWRKER